MSITAPEEPKLTSSLPGNVWKCHVCGFIHRGESPPEECPQCASTFREFEEITDKKKLRYDGKKFDVLLINGSNHRANNTGYMIDLIEEVLKEKGISYRRFNINEFIINHCWCCYSMRDNACRYPCRDQLDDMPAFHEMIIASKAVIVASPINWNNMAARLKDFLDRLNCIQNLYLLKKPGLTEGKIVGITVSGHEDGATKTAMDIYLYFQQMGYILAPFGVSYRTHGAQFNTNTDTEYLRNDPLVILKVKGMAYNVVEMLRLDIEGKLKGKLVPVCE
ncbi:NAD(P)H-dependent oxidoreductase [Methanoregula sp.]|uniref:NAD(P)H-dependent oxidoreductase n=1 Tax=Methanoregula sp. TaxID=2052170 RepID=UPI003D100092